MLCTLKFTKETDLERAERKFQPRIDTNGREIKTVIRWHSCPFVVSRTDLGARGDKIEPRIDANEREWDQLFVCIGVPSWLRTDLRARGDNI
jgi:hypothetical protein